MLRLDWDLVTHKVQKEHVQRPVAGRTLYLKKLKQEFKKMTEK